MEKIAFVTQSYKPDFDVCKLLCKSIDRFSPNVDHYIFVNDEDVKLFKSLQYKNHYVLGKSTILPWFFIRFPFKIAGHIFYLSPFTIPMREWIMQQICKLGVFEVLGNQYDAVFNIDSETILLKNFDINSLYKDGKYRLYRTDNVLLEDAHFEYCKSIKKFFGNKAPSDDKLYKYNYMDMPVCFVKDSLQEMLKLIAKNSIYKNWKLALANTYRFSENYTYGNYVINVEGEKNHYLTSQKIIPVLHSKNYKNGDSLYQAIMQVMNANSNMIGIVLQKTDRAKGTNYLDIDEIQSVFNRFLS